MGGIISTIRDVKVILRDLKITLKFTAKIVLKVHGIVDDMEQTMQELKETVNGLSSRLPKSASKDNSVDESTTNYVNEVVHTIETKAESMRASLSNAVAVFTSDDLVKNTSNAWENLVGHNNLTEVMTKWASVPDGIGELVKQDYERLSEYVDSTCGHNVIKTTSGAIKDVETKLSEKLDADIDSSIKNPSMEICKLISSDCPKAVHLLWNNPLINECFAPEIVIEDILTQRIDTGRLQLKHVGPLETFKARYNPEWLATILKTSPVSQMTMKHKSHQQINNSSSKTTENDNELKTTGEFQTEMLSLLIVSLLEGFLKNKEMCGTDNGNIYLGCD